MWEEEVFMDTSSLNQIEDLMNKMQREYLGKFLKELSTATQGA